MAEINEHNYEAFLLDSMEGRLTAEQQLELETFMALHPELALDLEGFALTSFDPNQAVFPDKQTLKKTEADLVPEHLFIAYIEGQLSTEDKQRVEKSCASNTSLAKELALYQRTIAKADERIVFEGKEKLKRRPKVIWLNARNVSFAAAASVALLLMLYVLQPAKTAESLGNEYALRDTRKSIERVTLPSQENTSLPETTQHNGPAYQPKQNTLPGSEPEKLMAQQVPAAQNTNQPSTTRQDSLPGLAKTPEKSTALSPEAKQAPALVASAARTTVVDVIIEHDDSDLPENQKKQGFWAMAGKTLKGLNKAGVKTVNGNEENNPNNAVYALTLGKLNITHKAH